MRIDSSFALRAASLLSFSAVFNASSIISLALSSAEPIVLAADFLAVNRNEKVTASVPVVLVGESKVEKLNEGKIQLIKDEVEVEAFPQDLPHNIEIDISKIESINDVIFVKDLEVSSKVRIVDDAEQPIVTVVELSDEEETPASEEAAAE